MDNEIHVSFEGGKKVFANFRGMEIQTDQPVKEGGEGSAPEPFVLFLASIGTCAGIYVKGYCDTRNIPTDNIKLVQRLEADLKGRLSKIVIDIIVPPDLPRKHRKSIVRAADLCPVKRIILNPPKFEVKTIITE